MRCFDLSLFATPWTNAGTESDGVASGGASTRPEFFANDLIEVWGIPGSSAQSVFGEQNGFELTQDSLRALSRRPSVPTSSAGTGSKASTNVNDIARWGP